MTTFGHRNKDCWNFYGAIKNIKLQEINVEGRVIEYVDPKIRDISVEMGRMKSLLNNVMSVASSAASLTGRL